MSQTACQAPDREFASVQATSRPAGETADAGNADVRRAWTAGMVFRTETVLVCGNLALAHAMLDVDWHLHGVRAGAGLLAGAVLGVAGCALAVSSSLAQREYRRV